MADPVVVEAQGMRDVTLNGTVSQFDLLAHNGTNWVQADADSASTYAQLVALKAGVSGQIIPAAKYVRLTDSDAPYTQDAIQYLSTTAGAHTETRPSGAGDIAQVVGRALSTSEVEIDILPPREISITLSGVPYGAAAGTLVDDLGAGYALADTTAGVSYNWKVPMNCVNIEYAEILYSTNVTLDASDTYQIQVASIASGEDHATNPDTTLNGPTAATLTADLQGRINLATGLDAAGVAVPGDLLVIDLIKIAEGGAGDDQLLLGCEIVYKAV